MTNYRTIKLTAWDVGAIEHALRRDADNLNKASLEKLLKTINAAREIKVKVVLRQDLGHG